MTDTEVEPATSPEPEASPATDASVAGEPEVFDKAYVSKLREENSKHRRQNNALADRLLEITVNSVATELADPADLLTYVDRATLLDEDGLPDSELIAAAVEDLLERKPHLRSRGARGDIDQGGRGKEVESFSFNDWLKSAAR